MNRRSVSRRNTGSQFTVLTEADRHHNGSNRNCSNCHTARRFEDQTGWFESICYLDAETQGHVPVATVDVE